MIKILYLRKITLTIAFFMVLSAVTNCGSNNMNAADKPENHLPTATETSVQNGGNAELPSVDLSKIPTATYCELINNASDYDHKIIRVRAIYGNEFERSFLFDSNCQKDSPPVAPKLVPAETWAEWDKSFVSEGDSAEAKLNQQIKGFGRKDVTLIGRFFSTNEVSDNNALNLFGHDNCCRFQFLIMRVENVHSIIGKPAESANKFGERIKFKVNQNLEFAGFTLEYLEFSKSDNTFRVKENDKEMTISADNNTPTTFNFNGITYKLELGVADKSGRIASDELIVSKINN